MIYSQSVLFSEDVTSDDDIDRLFSQLEQIEPPTSLVDSILASVAQLANQQKRSNNILANTCELIVHQEDKQPS